ncbi:MAG: hypothetical protein IBX39_10310 [Candidatus Methanoperedenaceae archaeon]|nr:hypothetical protein [Candidatus Methanoperedenaceae archaeon]MDW7727036.1 hypothetical protein [Candidatus Methanoperedens sp.]
MFLHSTTPPDDYHLRLKPFDIMFHGGQDLRGKELADRKKKIHQSPHRYRIDHCQQPI